MKIGFVQFAPALGEVAATMAKLAGLRKAFRAADLVVLPELANSGYNFASAAEAEQSAEDAREGAFVRFLLSLSREHGQYIVTGLNERDQENGKLYNTAVLLGPDGFVGKYRKLHLFVNEKDYFEPGDLGLPVFDIGVCKIGLLICFDWIFPETWRTLALRGADLVCHPSNLVLPGLAQRCVPIMALMNRMFVVTANRIGRERDLTFTGMSLIAGPKGEMLAQAPSDGTHVEFVEIDVARARDKMVTPRNHILEDRRPDEYAELVRRS